MVKKYEPSQKLFKFGPITTSKKIDLYLSENLPDLMDEYRLATKRDLKDVDRRFEYFDNELNELDEWKNTTTRRVNDITKRIERLEFKAGKGK